ncbi:MAG TPA: hypothetical protein VIH11_03545, partial [Gemmatimonadaceae bacterium]
STLASEATALAAAIAVLEWHRTTPVCESLARIGREMRDAVGRAMRASGIAGVHLEGIEPMWFLRFESPAVEACFVRAAARHGVLLKRGPYNFASLAHDEETVHEIEAAASNAFVETREAGDGADGRAAHPRGRRPA